LLLLLALRPLEAPPRPAHAALARLEGTETLRLEALSPVETVALAAARLGLAPDALPAEVADLVRERAGGNPFFAEELAYALRDSGAIVVAEGTCTLAGDLATLRERVPDTVEGVVLSRIDRLPPERQLTLKVAAVIGRSFLYRTLRDVHPRQVVADLLQAHLDDLAQRDLTLLEALEPELSYLFKHVITQQVTYDTLLFAQRRELHRAVAGWYERVYDRDLSPYYPLLVHHWNRAEDVERECHYARLAGEQAAAQFANTEAVAYLSRALDLAPERDPARRYTLLLAREQVYGLQGARRAQAQDLAALEALATQVDDDELQVAKRRAEVALRRTQYAEVTGDYPAAIASAQEAVHLAQAAQDVSSEVLGYLRWGAALWRQGEYEAAMHRGKRSLDLSRAMGLPQLEAASLCLLGSVARYQNKPSSTRAYHEQALRAYRQIGDRRGESVTLNSLGVFFAWQSDAPSARNYYEQALRVFREMGDRQNEGLQLNDLGLLYDQQGDVAQARDYLQQALRITREVDDRRGESQVLNSLGTIAAKLGNYTQAGHCLQQARHITRELGDRFEESITLYRLGDLYRRQGCYERARDCFQQALAIKRELGFWQGERWDLSELCRISYRLGQDDAAREYGRQALQVAQEIDDRHGCTYALFLSGQDLLNQGRLAEAAQAYEQAIASYREQGRRAAAVESLAGLARVCLAQGELAQAQVHVEEILNSLGNPLTVHALAGFGEPFQVPLTCYRVLHANRDPRAWDVLDTAYRLVQERAAGIEDEELRRSFLENVQVHRQIITAYERAHQVIGENGQMGGTR
ncbi:MAG: tetratricopeptide repeat protein, partial [Promethearchaeota archaeon]